MEKDHYDLAILALARGKNRLINIMKILSLFYFNTVLAMFLSSQNINKVYLMLGPEDSPGPFFIVKCKKFSAEKPTESGWQHA